MNKTKFDHKKALLVPVNDRNQILIQDRRGYKKPDWGFFGGEIEKSESPVEAVIRESKEELDLDINEEELYDLGTSVVEIENLTIFRHLFLYKTNQENFNVFEGRGARWFSFDEARELMRHKEVYDRMVEKIKRAI